jgi:hypothetical protein
VNLARILDIVIPRFVTEDVAVKQVGRSSMHEIVCSMKDIRPRERFDGIATYRMFNLFGFGFFQKQIGEVRPWANPHGRAAQ